MEEHTYERALIEKTQLALFSDDGGEFIASAARLIRILSGHSLKEERVLFPLAEQVLTREEAAQVTTRIEQADAEFGYKQKQLLIQMLKELERKYLPAAA